jgi:hypothetical protein
MSAAVAALALAACSINSATFSPPSDATGALDAAAPGELVMVVSARDLMVGETAQQTFTVALTSPPASPLAIHVTSSSDAKLAVSPQVLVFQAAEFAAPQTVTISGRDDDDTLDESQSVSLTATGIATTTVQVTVRDDDVLGIVTTPSSGIDVSEAGTAALAVRLNHQPSEATAIALVSSNPLAATIDATTLTFTPANWNVDQTVAISGVPDANITNEHADIALTASGLVERSVGVTVVDDDILGIEPSSTNLGSLGEATATSFTVRLSQQPSGDTAVSVVSSDPLVAAVTPSSLTFTPANWDTPQTVAVAAPQDADASDNTASISLAATGLTTRLVAVAVVDDDVQAITATPSPLMITEGATGALAVRLAFRPAANVAVTASSLDPAVATVTPASLTFTPANYATPQTVTVAGVEDANAAPGTGAIRLEATAAALATDVPVTVTDNDVLAIESSVSALSLAEGGSAAFQVRLTAMPLASVTVAVSSADPGAATVSPSALSFTPGNWNSFQSVTVAGTEDADLASESVAIALTATGLATKTVTATVSDNDTQQILASSASLGIAEGATGSVGVSLKFQPAGNVTVTVASSNPAVATASPATLTFTPANFATAQSVTVTGVQDGNASNDAAAISLTAPSIATATVAVNVSDDDVLAILTSVSVVSVNEGGTATFQVRLGAQPAVTTTVTLVSNDASAVAVSPAALSFTPANFGSFQTVTVTGVEDADAAAETAAIILSATGLANVNVGVNVADNDTLAISTGTTALSLGEAGAASFAVHLTAMPSGNVTVNLASSDPGAATVAPTTMTFTPGNWSIDQSATVAGVADSDAANETVSITCSSTGLTSRVVTASVIDDDTQALVVSTASLTVSEQGSGTFGVHLAAQPGGNTVVSITSSDPGAATASPSSLTFTPANWSADQTVAVAGVDDADQNHESVAITVASAPLASRTVAIAVADDDLITVPSDSILLCAGQAQNVQVSLARPIGGTVALNVTSGPFLIAEPASLSFTTAGTQSINITATAVLFAELSSVTISGPDLTSRFVTVTILPTGDPSCMIIGDVCGDDICTTREALACNCSQDCPLCPIGGPAQ